jgi:GTPase
MILVASKCDVANKTKLAKLKKFAKAGGLELYPISAVTGEGVEKLKYAMSMKVEEVQRTDTDRLGLPDPFASDQRPTTSDEP